MNRIFINILLKFLKYDCIKFFRKYLRDVERLYYFRLVLDYCLSVIKNRLLDIREM